jgi:hypothetical protein
MGHRLSFPELAVSKLELAHRRRNYQKWDDLRGDARFEKIVASVAAPLKIE